MIVSWNWLNDYVRLDMPVEELTHRLTMTGLNLEGLQETDGDWAIDLEVTSNRPDCLGHIGVAREISALFEHDLRIPSAEPATIAEATAAQTAVRNDCPDLCPQYFARLIRGVQVGPSPDWLRRRLEVLGIPSINNVVDITNYVLMESGQPLHAFDFDKLRQRRIVVRRAEQGETIVAIEGRQYSLDASMCVIADAERPVAIGGIMGGLETEIGENTVNVLIETAEFAPLSIRNTARTLNLHSDSSYRFERGVDPLGLDWASRRCCELILQLAGGELLAEPVFAGTEPPQTREPIILRSGEIPRILGIDVPQEEARGILQRLGLKSEQADESNRQQFVPPSWRRDLSREADLIEEVARIHGYEAIPEDADIPAVSTAPSRHDRVKKIIREVLPGLGFYEAITLSLISEEARQLFTPRGEIPPVQVDHPSRRQENILRQSLIPSLLASRRENERQGTFNAELFEIAKVYLGSHTERPEHEVEPTVIGCVTGRSYRELKGVMEALAGRLNRHARLSVGPSNQPQFAAGRGAEIWLNDQFWGWLGELDRSITDRLDLRDAVTVAELDLGLLESVTELTPLYTPLPQYPAVARDLNFVLEESRTWTELAETIAGAAGPLFDGVAFGGEYRGQQIEAGQKSYLATVSFRSPERTLTAEEVERAQQAIVEACREKLGARLRG